MLDIDSTGTVIQVDDLDTDWLLSLCEDAEAQTRAAEARKLRLAAVWGRRHPADPDQAEQGHVELGGGEGCPPVAEFTAEPLGAALQISTHAAQQLLADALDHERRPESRQPPQSPAARTPRHAASHATAPAGHRYGMTTTPQDPDTVEPEIVPSTDPVIPDPMPGEDPGVPDTQPDPMP